MKAQRQAKCILHNISADSIDLLNQACQLDHRSLNVRRVFLPKVQTLLHLSRKIDFRTFEGCNLRFLHANLSK